MLTLSLRICSRPGMFFYSRIPKPFLALASGAAVYAVSSLRLALWM